MTRSALNMEIANVMDELKYGYDDEFSYTTRYTVPPIPEYRETIAAKVRERCAAVGAPEDAEKFLKLMEDLEWDVSFLVDGF